MKLRMKIQLIFGITMVVLLAVVGLVNYYTNYASYVNNMEENLTENADMAAAAITEKMEDYRKIVTGVGHDEILGGNASNEKKEAQLNFYIEQYDFDGGDVLDMNGNCIFDGAALGEEDYVQSALQGEYALSDVELNKETGSYAINMAAPIYANGDKTVKGVICFTLNADFLHNLLGKIKVSESSYSYLIDANGDVIVHSKVDDLTGYTIDKQEQALQDATRTILDNEEGYVSYRKNGDTMMCGYDTIEEANGWNIVVVAPESDFMSEIQGFLIILLIVDTVACILALLISVSIAGYIAKPVKNVQQVMTAIAKGDFSTKVEKTNGKDELAELRRTASSLLNTLSGIIGEANHVLGSIAEGDLRIDHMRVYPGEFNTLACSVNAIKEMLSEMIVEVQSTAANVETGSKQLVDATSMLSEGTVTQASSIQQLMSDMGEVAECISNSSENGKLVNEKLHNLNIEIQNGNDQMTELRERVKDIEEMSEDIQKVVGTINTIAFQTNLLAFNASVEAARAGENGKGFAVVASEVGELASKSSEESKKTEQLIDRCIASIMNAKECADRTFESLHSIVVNSEEISQAFDQIANDTKEQQEKSVGVQSEISNISSVVQSNTATAEETAASTDVLSQQAMNLDQMVKLFKVN